MNLQKNIMYMIALLVVFLNVITTEAASGDVRLARGTSRYGFVEMLIGDEWKPVCPGDNYKDNSAEISNAVCQQLRFKTGIYYGGMEPNPGYNSWWYTEFQKELFSTPLVPKLDAYKMQNWLKVSDNGQYESCKRTTMAVICRGSVYLQVGDDRDIAQSSVRGLGYVVVDDTSKTVVNEDGLNVNAVNVICKELGYSTGEKVGDANTVGFLTSYTVQKKLYNCAGTEASLTDCQTRDMPDSNQKPAIISCSSNNNVQNFTARVASNQVVEIMNQSTSTWGVICADGFTNTDASVVCKSLGFNGGKKVTAQLREIYPIWIKQLNCDEGKTSPADCAKTLWTTSDSKCQSVAAVRCDTGTSFRLANGGGEYFGNHFFERTSNSQTGLISIEKITGSDVCKALGFASGNMYDIPVPSLLPNVASYWTLASGINYLDNIYINSNWKYKTDGMANGVQMAVCHDIVYLKGNGYAGLVYYDRGSGSRGLINKATLSTEETNLLCKHLGYTNGGTQVPALNYQSADSQNDIYDMQCDAGATDISTCTFTKLTSKTNIEIAAIKCSLSKPLPMDDNNVFLGNKFVVNVVKQGVPGAICASDTWNDNAAMVVCRQMGFDVAVRGSESIDNSYGTNFPPVWYKSISCQGSETSISSCTLQPLTSGDTLCRKVASVVCYNKANKAKLELVDGTSRFGRVKITREGKEGFLCLDKLGEEEAGTVCREVGYKDGNEWPMEPVDRSGIAWWYVSTNCDDETKIIEGCKGQKWKYVTDPAHECSWKTSSVYCYSNVRLSTAPYLSYGPIRNSETKARFSSDSFGKKEADIGCKEMGYSKGGSVITSAVFDEHKKPIIIQCTGNEKSLLNCTQTGESSDKKKFASVSCTTDEIVPTDTSFKLNDDYRVLISRSGVWGGLCADKWTQKDAAVVCGQLMGGSGKTFAKGRVKVEYATFKEPWNCVGSEQNLINCPVDNSVVDKSCDTYAAVYCDNQKVTALDTSEYPLPPGQTLTTAATPTVRTGVTDGTTGSTRVTDGITGNSGATPTDGGGNTGNSIAPSISILTLFICIFKVHRLVM